MTAIEKILVRPTDSRGGAGLPTILWEANREASGSVRKQQERRGIVGKVLIMASMGRNRQGGVNKLRTG